MVQDNQFSEVKPLDPGNMDKINNTERPIPDVPPEFSIGELITLFRELGISEALKDEAWGPHVHLLIILFTVFIIAILIGIITWVTTL